MAFCIEDYTRSAVPATHAGYARLIDRERHPVLTDSSNGSCVRRPRHDDVRRTASRYEAGLGSAMSWVMMLAHRRAVDRVRSAQAAAEREQRVGRAAGPRTKRSPRTSRSGWRASRYGADL
jgi:hypothetical protein